jgi:hypothetical protein
VTVGFFDDKDDAIVHDKINAIVDIMGWIIGGHKSKQSESGVNNKNTHS